MNFGWRIVPGLVVVLVTGLASAGEPPPVEPPAPEPVDYVQDIKPLLSRRCYSCHGALKQKNELRLDTAALAIKGGQSGPALVAGKSGESLLIEAVTGEGGVAKMPPEGIIAFQLHAGYKSMEVTFKDLKFTNLSAK